MSTIYELTASLRSTVTSPYSPIASLWSNTLQSPSRIRFAHALGLASLKHAFNFINKPPPKNLSVRLLVSGSGTGSTKLLGLHSSGIGNQQSSVERSEGLLELVLGLLVDKLLVESNETLGNGLSDGVNLGHVSSTGHLDSDVNVGKLVEANNEERLVDLESQNSGLNEGDGGTVELDEALAGLDVGNGGGGLFLSKGLG